MRESETLGSFFKTVKEDAKNWMDIRVNIYKLKATKLFSKIAGNLAWFIISLFLFLLFAVFAGLTAGFWLSQVTGSYPIGFGIVTAVIVIKIALLAAFRKKLFINPIIRMMIDQSSDETPTAETDPQNNYHEKAYTHP